MKRSLQFLAAAALLAGLSLFLTAPAQAAPPTYLFLTGPTQAAGPHHGAAPASYGYVQPVPATPYAYGWFGASCPRWQFVRHFGYYRQYTEWKAQ